MAFNWTNSQLPKRTTTGGSGNWVVNGIKSGIGSAGKAIKTGLAGPGAQGSALGTAKTKIQGYAPVQRQNLDASKGTAQGYYNKPDAYADLYATSTPSNMTDLYNQERGRNPNRTQSLYANPDLNPNLQSQQELQMYLRNRLLGPSQTTQRYQNQVDNPYSSPLNDVVNRYQGYADSNSPLEDRYTTRTAQGNTSSRYIQSASDRNLGYDPTAGYRDRSADWQGYDPNSTTSGALSNLVNRNRFYDEYNTDQNAGQAAGQFQGRMNDAQAFDPTSMSAKGLDRLNTRATDAAGFDANQYSKGALDDFTKSLGDSTYSEQRYKQMSTGQDPAAAYQDSRALKALDRRAAAGGYFNSGGGMRLNADYLSNVGAQRSQQLSALAGQADESRLGAYGLRSNMSSGMDRANADKQSRLDALARDYAGQTTSMDQLSGTNQRALDALFGKNLDFGLDRDKLRLSKEGQADALLGKQADVSAGMDDRGLKKMGALDDLAGASEKAMGSKLDRDLAAGKALSADEQDYQNSLDKLAGDTTTSDLNTLSGLRGAASDLDTSQRSEAGRLDALAKGADQTQLDSYRGAMDLAKGASQEAQNNRDYQTDLAKAADEMDLKVRDSLANLAGASQAEQERKLTTAYNMALGIAQQRAGLEEKYGITTEQMATDLLMQELNLAVAQGKATDEDFTKARNFVMDLVKTGAGIPGGGGGGGAGGGAGGIIPTSQGQTSSGYSTGAYIPPIDSEDVYKPIGYGKGL